MPTMSLSDLPTPVVAYLRPLPALRRDRLHALLQRARHLCPQARMNLRLNMPTLDHHGRWLAFANEARHLAIYVPQPGDLAPFLARHPQTERGPDSLRFGDYAPFPMADMDLIFQAVLPNSSGR